MAFGLACVYLWLANDSEEPDRKMGTRKRGTRRDAASEPEIRPARGASDENEDGFESLRSAADRELGKNSRKIAVALGEKAARGDLNSAKFLVAMVEKKAGKGARKKRHGPSAVERLLLEPAWEEPAESDETPGEPSH
jgi:hypothetical protein